MAYSKLFLNEYETVLHIFVKDYETAKEVISKFESGHDFCDLVVEYSLDKDTHDKCGNLKYSAYEGILLLVPRPEVIENFLYILLNHIRQFMDITLLCGKIKNIMVI